MATLYVTEPGARIEREYKRIIVTKQGDVLLAVPLFKIDEIVLIGSVGVTTPALVFLLDQGVGFTIITNSGRILGKLASQKSRNIQLLRKQYDSSACLDQKTSISRAIVFGKLSNCRVMMLRLNRALIKSGIGKDEVLKPLLQIEDCIRKTKVAVSLDAIRGFEGLGTRAYFATFRKALKPAEYPRFQKRERRPPPDPTNILLSLGYTLLTNAMITACEVCGLDAYAGFLHSDKPGRPSLALDLIEEFRPIIVDSIVLRMINQKIITARHFVNDPEGRWILSRTGLKKVLTQFNSRIHTPIRYQAVGRVVTYQKMFEIQARKISAIMIGKSERYEPMRIR